MLTWKFTTKNKVFTKATNVRPTHVVVITETEESVSDARNIFERYKALMAEYEAGYKAIGFANEEGVRDAWLRDVRARDAEAVRLRVQEGVAYAESCRIARKNVVTDVIRVREIYMEAQKLHEKHEVLLPRVGAAKVVSWHSREDLAKKKAESLRKSFPKHKVEVLEGVVLG